MDWVIRFLSVSSAKLSTLAVALLALLLVAVAASSIQWRMIHDSPIYFYMAYLINHWGLVPYRDFFDVNMPGVHLFYSLAGRIFGYGDLAFRRADLLYLVAIVFTTFLLMRGFGKLVAILAGVIFGLYYLSQGPALGFQRDYLLILPVAFAVLVATSTTKRRTRWGAFLVGALFGIAFTLKPTAVIGYPFVLAHQAIAASRLGGGNYGWVRGSLRVAIPSGIGLLIPVAIMLIFLQFSGSLPAFLDIAQNYWPTYTSMNGSLSTGMDGIVYKRYLLQNFLEFSGYEILVIPAVLGFYVARSCSALSEPSRELVMLLGVMAVSYAFYTLVAGKFWNYHWLPFFYFISLLGSLCLVECRSAAGRVHSAFPAAVLLFSVVVQLVPGSFAWLNPPAEIKKILLQKHGRVDQIADFLVANLQPGDRVQALDWTGGAIHAMLIARARTATPYIYDVMFYQQVGTPYTQRLRQDFLAGMTASSPRFIIEIVTGKPWPMGSGTTQKFDGLSQFLKERYVVRVKDPGFRIHERID